MQLAGKGALVLNLTTSLTVSALALEAPAGSVDNADKFAKLSDEFVKESLRRSPTAATEAGYHVHIDSKSGESIDLDSLLDDLSKESMDDGRAFYSHWQKRFLEETPKTSLSAEDAADWQLVNDKIKLELLELDEIQNYKHNPSLVVELIGSAIFQLLSQPGKDKQARLKALLCRIDQIPRILNSVREYLCDADAIYVKNAIEENEGNIDLINTTVAREISGEPALQNEFNRVSPPAIEALKGFSTWLQQDQVRQPGHRSWRLGGLLYSKKFRLVMETEIDPEALLIEAEQGMKDVRGEMMQLAIPLHEKMYPMHGKHDELSAHARENLIISEVLRKISDHHPKREDLQKAIEADLENIKAFIRDTKIVSLSPRNNLKVIPTPVFMRGIYSVAGFHSAPPLEPDATAEYWVTPIDPKLPEEKAESRLREYNDFSLKWLTIHEALPGHYIQFEHLNNILPPRRRLIRALYSNGAYVEGWAEYIAQVMLDSGFMKDEPFFRMTMHKIRLRVLANAILDIRMHTHDMEDDEAMCLMTEEAFQTQAEAEGKLRRAKLSSTQLPTYYAGLREWLAFRKTYEAFAGQKFDMLDFHNKVLDEGALPVGSVQKLMMSH